MTDQRACESTGVGRRNGDADGAQPETTRGTADSAAHALCLRLLTARPRTRVELATALHRRGFAEQVTTTVLDRLVDVGLINDADYAATLTRSAVRDRGLSRRAISVALHRRGVDRATAEQALAAVDPTSELETATALALRRQRTIAALPAHVQARRLAGYLQRRGYSMDVTQRAVHAACGAAE